MADSVSEQAQQAANKAADAAQDLANASFDIGQEVAGGVLNTVLATIRTLTEQAGELAKKVAG